ncbi:MAG: circularly permuted type 2 ATP-grasp protein [Pseudomonadota bacterium]
MTDFFDEMGTADGPIRDGYQQIARWLEATTAEQLRARSREAELLFRRIGITFAVYGQSEGEERIIPFDIVPRVLTSAEWTRLSAGLEQRVKALNLFLGDIYGEGEILRAGLIPEALVYQNTYFRPEMVGVRVPHGVYVPVCGIDVVRVDSDTFYVLEDNLRTPSGVSYMLENREVTMRLVPELFSEHKVAPVEQYPNELLSTLQSLAPPRAPRDPTVVILTPGPLNSAYYEHSFLADRLGVELVEGRDLFVSDNRVFMRTTQGPRQVDVIYRRIDDDYLDPLAFRPDSILGVPGLIAAYRSGHVAVANAMGTGVADDKAVYTYMPEIIEFYLGEQPILNNVPTYRCREPEALSYVLDNLAELVVKEVAGSGGYGMLVGPRATADELELFRGKLRADPDEFIAQPTLALSTCPTFVGEGIAPRHVDLRPFVLTGSNGVRTVPGGLTRVALKEGSLVVNSSQGGGTKDTWVLDL